MGIRDKITDEDKLCACLNELCRRFKSGENTKGLCKEYLGLDDRYLPELIGIVLNEMLCGQQH